MYTKRFFVTRKYSISVIQVSKFCDGALMKHKYLRFNFFALSLAVLSSSFLIAPAMAEQTSPFSPAVFSQIATPQTVSKSTPTKDETKPVSQPSIDTTSVQSSVTAPSTTERIKVLSYNVGLFTAPIVGDQVPVVEERAKKLIEILPVDVIAKNVDVGFFLELWNDRHATDLGRALKSKDYTVFRPTDRVPGAYGSGLLLALKKNYRMVYGPLFVGYTQQAGIQKLTRHGMVFALLETPNGKRFVLAGTHTQAVSTKDGKSTNPGEYFAIEEQVKQLKKLLDIWTYKQTYPALLVGDFNVGPNFVDSIFEQVMNLPGMVNHSVNASAPWGNAYTWDKQNPLVKFGLFPNDNTALIDHIFTSDGIKEEWSEIKTEVVYYDSYQLPATESKSNKKFREKTLSPATNSYVTPLSDHYGLEGEFELKKKAL